MKRYLALFTATLLLVANCIVYTPVKAVGTSVDFAEIFSEYLSLAEMSMALSQGVEIDWSSFEFDENDTNQEKAKALLNYYYGLIYNGLDFFLDLSGNQDVISNQMAAVALQTSGNLSSNNIQDLRSQLSNALQNYAVTGNWNIPIMQHYDDLCIANWNKYNSLYINDYLDNITYDDDAPPTPTPNDNYLSAINIINGIDTTTRYSFFFANYPLSGTEGFNTGNQWNATSLFYPYTQYSWYFENNINASGTATPNGFPAPIQDINITSNNGVYSFSSTIVTQQAFTQSVSNSNQKGILFGYPGTARNGKVGYQWVYNTDSITIQGSGNLSQCFDILQNRIRNVNIYVDGQLWALANNNITSGLTFNVPDAVIDNSTDDGKIVSHPIYYPDAIKTDGLVNIDLDAVRDTIIDAIANGRSSITVDDIVDAGAAVKVDGTTLTDADTKTLDASIPIEAAKADTLTVPISAVPGLPKLPPIIPPSGSSGSTVPNGFSGMSVLARIINVTVQSVPEPLIMCFFGVIFGMVVLGIIKILHH